MIFFPENVFNMSYFFPRRILSIHPPIPEDLSIEVKDFISQLLTKDPSRRLGGGPLDAMELKQHSYFRVSSVTTICIRVILTGTFNTVNSISSIVFKLG